jgi:glycosyltransferase involved in cell wall biosynthesis
MQVVVEGFIYQVQAKGGISRIFNETMGRMCERDRNLRFTVLTDGTNAQDLPAHPSIRYQHHRLDPELVKSRSAIWHSTYFTPPEEWSGVEIVTVYDMVPERFSNFFCDSWDDALRAKRKKAILSADVVIAISDSTKRDVVDILGVNPARVKVVPLSHMPLFTRLDRGALPLPEKPYFLYVGDRNHYKNFDGLLRGFAQWSGNGAAELCVVGKPFARAEEKLIRELNLEGKVRLAGFVSDEDLVVLYNTAAAFVYPSYGEGFGIPLLESMACGCPVIASDIPSSREVAGDVPLYFQPGRPAELPALFDRILSEGPDSERIGSGLEWVEQYSWDKTAAETLRVYRDALRDLGRFDSCAFPSGHFYSPVPDLEEVAGKRDVVFANHPSLKGVDINKADQLALWDETVAFLGEYPFRDQAGSLRYGMSNDFFGHGDAWSLYGMLRRFTPGNIVEVGSGHSSAAILDINDLFMGGGMSMTFIDPNPERLHSLLKEADRERATILETRVQDVGMAPFKALGREDVLFVDSSHVSKVGSDLNHILFEVLPELAPGVVVHFHDIFYPFEYPEKWVFGGRFWNECYLLRAFLQNNRDYEILLFNSYLAQVHGDRVVRDVPFFLTRDPDNPWVEGCSSLWLRKKG